LEIAIRRYKIETLRTIFDKCIQIVVCVDDVYLWGREEDYRILNY
jgi:hypothetical protein